MENVSLKKEIKNLKKALYAYQIMAKLPNGISSQGPVVSSTYHRCLYCEKVFTAVSFLDSHLRRRHSVTPPQEKVDAPTESVKNEVDIYSLLQQQLLDAERKLRLDLECQLAKDSESRKVKAFVSKLFPRLHKMN